MGYTTVTVNLLLEKKSGKIDIYYQKLTENRLILHQTTLLYKIERQRVRHVQIKPK